MRYGFPTSLDSAALAVLTSVTALGTGALAQSPGLTSEVRPGGFTRLTCDAPCAVTLTLPVNISTGYRWYGSSTPALALREDFSAPEDMPGRGGVQSFRFEVAKSGIYRLNLRLARTPADVESESVASVEIDAR